MKRWGAPISILFLVICSSPRPCPRQDRLNLEHTKRVLEGMILEAIEKRSVPSVSIALVKGEDIIWTAAYGYSNLKTKTPASPETIYGTGSTFKAVTATAVMQLIDQGKIHLDDPVNEFLGETQIRDRFQGGKPVTFRHILSHWSGLNYGQTMIPLWERRLPDTLEDMVMRLYSIRPPEEAFEYNNYAYGMAGLLVEKISGMDYEDYVVEHILKPIGVRTPAPVHPTPEMVELLAFPYVPGQDRIPKPVPRIRFDVYPAGDIYLTAEDMARFLGVHINGGVFNGNRILSVQSVKEMHTGQFNGPYGLGYGIGKDDNGHTIISHAGGLPGFTAMMIGDLDAKVGVYFMSNCGAPNTIAKAAIKLLRGEEYIPRDRWETVQVAEEDLKKYAGEYKFQGRMNMKILKEGNSLYVQFFNGHKDEIFARSKREFFSKQTDAILTFVENQDSDDVYILLDLSGVRWRLTKIR